MPTDGLTMRDLVNRFLTAKQHLRDSGEITNRTFQDYFATCDRLIAAFGRGRLVVDLASEDFEQLRATLSKAWGPVALGNEIQRVRIVFKYAFDSRLIPVPVHFGTSFKRPSKRVLRKARSEKGPRMFDAAQVQRMLAAASVPFRDDISWDQLRFWQPRRCNASASGRLISKYVGSIFHGLKRGSCDGCHCRAKR